MEIQLQEVLKRELKSRNLTVNGLARSCGIPQSVLHSWLQGVIPSAKNLHHTAVLAKYFEIPISVLLFNQKEDLPETNILFHSEFLDGENKYKLSIEKVKKRKV